VTEPEEAEGGGQDGAALTRLGHSITSSARGNSEDGIVMPSVLAVFEIDDQLELGALHDEPSRG